MKKISHRGNTNGPDINTENTPEIIQECISKNLDVEIDVRFIDSRLFLGHDYGQYEIDIEFLLKYCDYLWIHCKNLQALNYLLKYKELNIFWHEKDQFTLTTHGYIWTYPNNKLTPKSICVALEHYDPFRIKDCFGVCSDRIIGTNDD